MKKPMCFFMVCIVLAALAIPAMATTNEIDLTYLDEQSAIEIIASWPEETPVFEFISPDGTVFDPTIDAENTVAQWDEKMLRYVIYGAQAGQWRVRYDLAGNESIQFQVTSYDNSEFRIQQCAMEYSAGANFVPVDFIVTGIGKELYSYRISVITDYSSSEQLLGEGIAYTGNLVSEIAMLTELKESAEYRIKLYVWKEDGNERKFDFAYSDLFTYPNAVAENTAPEYNVSVLPDQQTVVVTWLQDGAPIEEITAALFEGDKDEPAQKEVVSASKEAVELKYDPAATQITLSVAAKRNGAYSESLEKTISLAPLAVQLPDEAPAEGYSWTVAYQNLPAQDLMLMVNGSITHTTVSGSGSLDLTLADGKNAVVVRYITDEHITWQISRDVYIGEEEEANQPGDGDDIKQDPVEKILGGGGWLLPVILIGVLLVCGVITLIKKKKLK